MERSTPYIVYTPDGRRIVERSSKASGPWAVAYVRAQRGRWDVLCVLDVGDKYAYDRETMAVTAERITEREMEALGRSYGL